MYSIYCIEDCNSLKYVGSTEQTLEERFRQHKCRSGNSCSSKKLNLHECKIYSLETCNESERSEREKYWINKIDCVNTNKLNFDQGECLKKYYQANKQKISEYGKAYRENNKAIRKEYMKELDLFRSKKVVNGCYGFIKMLEEY